MLADGQNVARGPTCGRSGLQGASRVQAGGQGDQGEGGAGAWAQLHTGLWAFKWRDDEGRSRGSHASRPASHESPLPTFAERRSQLFHFRYYLQRAHFHTTLACLYEVRHKTEHISKLFKFNF